jgi:hypothetical protein
LASYGDTPLNIALFGPWGSGKSSLGELLRRDLAARNQSAPPRKVGFVPYEAWRYAGESLKRNFVASCAHRLELSERKHPEFYSGLYEERRAVTLDLRRAALGAATFGLFAALVVLCTAGVWALIDATHATLRDHSFRDTFSHAFAAVVAPSRAGAFIVVLVTALAALARLEIHRSAPSADEEFHDRFREMVRAGCERGKVERLLFFIDELDRCPPEAVVEVLTSIKAFLDDDRCVFVVAVDREVVEEALRQKLRQATTVNIDQPYFTSAASFIEKVFQHEVNLPPFRGRRLTAYARELVAGKNGLWGELRERDSSFLDQVTVALVPSHVRSPRQVKELLNNFATNFRIAQARNFDSLDRAEEIARMTVLETEFPSFARAIRKDVGLLRFLTTPQLTSDTATLRDLLGLGDKAASASDRDQPRAQRISGVLRHVPDEFTDRQFVDLSRYLQRTASIQGPRSDLLYFGAVAPELDPEDPTLGDQLELVATDAPSDAVRLLSARRPEVKLAGIGFLSEMVDDTFAGERDNVVRALTAAAAVYEGPWALDFREAGRAIESYSLDKDLDPSDLVGGLRLSRAVEGAVGGRMVLSIFERPDLWLDDGRGKAVLVDASAFRGRALNQMMNGFGLVLPDALVAHAFETLDGEPWAAFRAVVGTRIVERLATLEGEGDGASESYAAALVEAASRRSDSEIRVAEALQLLISSGVAAAYRVARDRAAAMLGQE